MHRKKMSALFHERAFYHGNKTRFFLLKEYSSLLKTRFYGHLLIIHPDKDLLVSGFYLCLLSTFAFMYMQTFKKVFLKVF